MSKTVKILLIVFGVVVIGAGVVMGVFMFRYARLHTADYGPFSMMRDDRWNSNNFGPGSMMGDDCWDSNNYGPGSMMRDDRWDDSDMQNWMRNNAGPGSFGRMNDRLPGGIDEGCGYDRMGGTATSTSGCGNTQSGMHGMGNLSGSGLYNQEPLTLAQAQDAVENYLGTLNNDDLELAEVMVFDNHAYAEIVEKSTGLGAMEVLVDPVTLDVLPEYGPNMMWNLKYGMMAGRSNYGYMGRGMMGEYWDQNTDTEVSADMDLTPEQAVANAQEYLDSNLPGAEVEAHADPFYGYYNLHVTRDGEVVGMLSVNGFTGDVFLHTWHGDFIEMSEIE